MTDEDVNELAGRIQELSEEKRKLLQEKMDEDPSPPRVGWSTDPLRLKATLKRLAGGDELMRHELADYLSSLDDIQDITSMHFGLVGRNSNDLFNVEKGDEKAQDTLSLTRRGEELDGMFDDDLSRLTSHEKALYRGLHQYGNQYMFLAVLEKHRQEEDGHEDGMLKEDLQSELKELYGKSAKNFTGYYGTLFGRLGLIERSKDGRKARYKLSVPPQW